jgi:hypothetical protein
MPISKRQPCTLGSRCAGTLKRFAPFVTSSNSIAHLLPSALSQLDFGIERLEFVTGIIDFHLPIHATLTGVNVVGPGTDFIRERKVSTRARLAVNATVLVMVLVLGK